MEEDNLFKSSTEIINELNFTAPFTLLRCAISDRLVESYPTMSYRVVDIKGESKTLKIMNTDWFKKIADDDYLFNVEPMDEKMME